MPPADDFHIMIKPVSGLCNMRCRYCFYADEARNRQTANFGRMREDTLRHVIEKTLENTKRRCTIAFQGGEPTLAGLDFFETAVRIVQAANTRGREVSYAIQTNGLAIDEGWCGFFARNRFLVGVSLDGPRALHDLHRTDLQGGDTHGRVLSAIRLLKKNRVDTNILTVVTSSVARNFRRVYDFYAREGFDYQQYIPCLDPLGQARGQAPWSLTPRRFEQYLKTAFDCWYDDRVSGNRRFHRYFDNLLLMMDGRRPEACGMGGVCGMQYVVEADGGVYPCDFYMLDAYRLGSLVTDSFAQIDERRAAIRFIEQSAEPAPECPACRWRPLCRGGCRRDRDYFEQGIGSNYYCEAYRAFFPYAYPRLEQLHRRIAQGR